MTGAVKWVCLVALCCCPVYATRVSIEPPVGGITSGTTVAVTVTDVSDLYAFQFDIEFTPLVMVATSVREGPLFSGRSVFFNPGTIDDTAGTIRFIAGSLSGSAPGISGDGTLAWITFANRILDETVTVQPSGIVLLDSSLAEIPATATGGMFTLVPEPGTCALLSAGLGSIGLVRLRRRRSAPCQ